MSATYQIMIVLVIAIGGIVAVASWLEKRGKNSGYINMELFGPPDVKKMKNNRDIESKVGDWIMIDVICMECHRPAKNNAKCKCGHFNSKKDSDGISIRNSIRYWGESLKSDKQIVYSVMSILVMFFIMFLLYPSDGPKPIVGYILGGIHLLFILLDFCSYTISGLRYPLRLAAKFCLILCCTSWYASLIASGFISLYLAVIVFQIIPINIDQAGFLYNSRTFIPIPLDMGFWAYILILIFLIVLVLSISYIAKVFYAAIKEI
jgi:hypothetical protein